MAGAGTQTTSFLRRDSTRTAPLRTRVASSPVLAAIQTLSGSAAATRSNRLTEKGVRKRVVWANCPKALKGRERPDPPSRRGRKAKKRIEMHGKRIVVLAVSVIALAIPSVAAAQDLDSQLEAALSNAGFTGTVGSSIESRLGRPINTKLANLG